MNEPGVRILLLFSLVTLIKVLGFQEPHFPQWLKKSTNIYAPQGRVQGQGGAAHGKESAPNTPEMVSAPGQTGRRAPGGADMHPEAPALQEPVTQRSGQTCQQILTTQLGNSSDP